MRIQLTGFDASQAAMVREAVSDLEKAGYDCSIIREIALSELPSWSNAMTWHEHTVLVDARAFANRATLICAIEEELLHLFQKEEGKFEWLYPGFAADVEGEVHDKRKFHLPESEIPGDDEDAAHDG